MFKGLKNNFRRNSIGFNEEIHLTDPNNNRKIDLFVFKCLMFSSESAKSSRNSQGEESKDEETYQEINLKNTNIKVINECEFRKYIRKFQLPPLETSFPYKRNPLDSHPKIRDWIHWNYEFSLMSKERFDKFKGTSIFSAYFYPFCNDLKRYENLVKYMIQFFVFDDHTEADWGDVARNMTESRKIWGQFGQMLDRLVSEKPVPMHNWKPYVMAMYSVFYNIFTKFNETQKYRCVEVWKNYMLGNIEETEALNNGVEFTDIYQMIRIRKKSIGFRPAAQLIEYADKIFISNEDWNDPRLQNLFDLMSEIFVYVNDFFSFEKEFIQQKGDLSQMFNLVALISRLDGIPIKLAMDRLAEMTRDLEMKIKCAENEILNDQNCNNRVIITFIQRMNYFIGGNHKVSTVLDRYNKFIK